MKTILFAVLFCFASFISLSQKIEIEQPDLNKFYQQQQVGGGLFISGIFGGIITLSYDKIYEDKDLRPYFIVGSGLLMITGYAIQVNATRRLHKSLRVSPSGISYNF